MMTHRRLIGILCSLAVAALATPSGAAQDSSEIPADAAKYALRYQFQPGETLRWRVSHRVDIRTTVSGATQTAKTTSKSIKLWRVGEVDAGGAATFEHLVEDVQMRQNLAGRDPLTYDSRSDAEPPGGFQGVADAVGVPLSVVTMDPTGKILKRQRKQAKAATPNEGPMTIPLPELPVAVGETWTFPQTISVKLKSGVSKTLRARQSYTLEGVQTGVATIRVATRILTPLRDPTIESQVVQHESTGTVRFDIDAGRMLSQRMDIDKHVVGFRGEASSLHYNTRFTEEFLPEKLEVASRSTK